MAAGNSLQGGAGAGASDGHSVSGEATIGAFDAHSLTGEALVGAFDSQSIRGEGVLGVYDGHSLMGAASVGALDAHSVSGEGTYGVPDVHSMIGGGAYGVFDSQSMRGEGTYGAFDSQSTEGTASVSGVPITIPGLTTVGGLQCGLFFKIGYTGFANSVVLVQFGLPSSGYINLGLTTTPAVQAGISATGNGGSWSLTGTSPTISPNTWYYVTYALGVTGGNVVQRLYVYQNGVAGFYDEGQASTGAAVTTDTNLTAVFGLGQVTSTSTTFTSWQNFPNVAGWEMSKFWMRNANPASAAWGGPYYLPVPTSDQQIATMSPAPLIYYNCRQTAGTITTLTDNSGNGYSATAGPNGLQITVDGPYA